MNTFDPNNPYNYYADEANRRADNAMRELQDCRRELEAERASNRSNLQLVMQLRDKLQQTQAAHEQVRAAHAANAALAADKARLEKLLDAPFAEIAAAHAGFRANHDAAEVLQAKLIWSEKAYRETAMTLSAEAGKTADEFAQLFRASRNAVMSDSTVHGNNAADNKLLSQYCVRPAAAADKTSG